MKVPFTRVSSNAHKYGIHGRTLKCGIVQRVVWLNDADLDWKQRKCDITCRFQDSNGNFCSLIVLMVLFHFDSCTGWHKTPNPPEMVGQGKKELKCTTSFKHRCKWEESCFIIVYVLFSPVGLPSSSSTFLELSGREVALEHLCFHFYLLFFSSAVSAQDKATWILAGQTTSVWFPRNHPCVYNWPSARQSFVTHGFTFTLRNIKI